MTFEETCIYCAGNKELINEFNRLSGYSMGKAITPLEKQIDAVCGYDPDKEAFPAFVSFVREFVWPYI